EIRARLDRGAGDLEHRQVAGDAAAVAMVLGGVGDDVVADLDDPHVHALGAQLLRRGAEVQHVPGIVAEAQHHAAAVLRVAGEGGGRQERAPTARAGWPFGASVARPTPPRTPATCSGWDRASPATASVAKSAGSLKRYVIVGFLRRLPRDRRRGSWRQRGDAARP